MKDDEPELTEQPPAEPASIEPDSPEESAGSISGGKISEAEIDRAFRDMDRGNKQSIDGEQNKTEQDYARPFVSLDYSSARDVAGTIVNTIHNYHHYGVAEKQTLGTLMVERVTDSEKRRIQSVYVSPSFYIQAQHILEERHVLLLWGDATTGKATTALHLLLECYESVVRIDPSTELEHIKSCEFDQRQGFLVDTLASSSASGFDDFMLDKLSRQLCDAHSYLVITIDRQTELNSATLQRYLLVCDQCPDMAEMLHKHLLSAVSTHAPEVQERAKQLLHDPRILDALKRNPSMGDIARLAQLLQRVSTGQVELDDAIVAYHSMLLAYIERWFRSPQHSQHDRALMITLAVFSGASQSLIQQAERALIDYMPKEKPAAETKSFDLFASWHDRLRAVEAHQDTEILTTNIGKVETPIIVFHNDYYQPAVLSYVWQELAELREGLLKWLSALGQNATMRGYAAAAVGYLARHDITTVINRIITPWAMSEAWSPRAAAALALGVLGSEERYTSNVLKLLDNWSKPTSTAALKLTAAMAYGGAIGKHDPIMAFRRLSQITMTEVVDRRLLYQVIDSTMALFQHRRNDPAYILKVLEALVIWTGESRLDLTIWCGLVAFLRITRSRTRATPGDGYWPTLLWLCEEDKECRKRIITLWRRALDNHLTESYALHIALRRWLRLVFQDMRLYNVFRKLLRSLMRGEQDNLERIEYWLEELSDSDDQYAQFARKLSLTLSE